MDVTNVKDMNSQDTNEWEENIAYQKVDEMIKGKSIRIWDMPKGMKFIDYSINEEIQQADLFYKYKGETIRYEIYLNKCNKCRI